MHHHPEIVNQPIDDRWLKAKTIFLSLVISLGGNGSEKSSPTF